MPKMICCLACRKMGRKTGRAQQWCRDCAKTRKRERDGDRYEGWFPKDPKKYLPDIPPPELEALHDWLCDNPMDPDWHQRHEFYLAERKRLEAIDGAKERA